MAKTKVPGGYISDEAITSAHLHSSHGITTNDIGEHTNNKYYTDARVDTRLAASKSSNIITTGNIDVDSDSGKLRVGAGADLRIYHNASDSYLDNFTGNLNIKNFADNQDISFWSDDGSGGTAIYFRLDGSAATAAGVYYTFWGDNSRIALGDSKDLRLYHNGTNSIIQNVTDGDLVIQNDFDDQDIIIKSDNGSGGVTTYFMADGSLGQAQLYHYGTLKFHTTSAGAEVEGNLNITGNLTVTGTTTTVDTVTMNAQNAVVFEGATADDHETTLTIIDPTADRTINLPNQSGTIPVLAAASNTAITATPTELNYVDGVTSAIQTQIDSKQATISSTTDLTLSSVIATSSNESRFTALSIGADADIYLYESATNAFTIRTGASGAYKYLTLGASGQLNISGAGLATAGTERISSGGNLTNIGTIGSGAITSTGASSFGSITSGAIDATSSAEEVIRLNTTGNTAAIHFRDSDVIRGLIGFSNGSSIYGGADDHDMVFRSEAKLHLVTNVNQLGLTLSGGNATFAGTIGSGAITSTGALTGTSLDINGTGDVSGDLTIGTAKISSTGSIELFRASGAFIDFKDSSSDDFDSRIMGGNNLVFTVGGAGSSVTGLTLSSGSATFNGDIITTKAGGDLQFNGGSTGYVKSTTGLELDFDSDNNQSGMNFKITHNGGTELFKISNSGAIRFNQAYTFPTGDGSANQVLRTDGSGNLSFATVSSGGSGFSTITEPEAGQLKIGAQSGANEGGEILLEKASANGGGSYTSDIHLDNYQNTFRIHSAGNVPFSVAAATGNATILGTLTTGGDITLPNDKDIHFLKADGSNDGTRITRASGNALRLKYTGNIFAADAIADHAFQVRNSAGDIVLSVNPNATAASSTTDIRSGALRMNTTTIVDVNRNLTNIGTIASSNITVTTNSDSAVGLTLKRYSSTGRAQFVLADESGSQLWRVGATGAGGTTFAFYSGSANALELDRTTSIATFASHVNIGTLSTTGTGSLYLNGSTANKRAELLCTNGNLHIDADDGNGIYLNWYGAQSATSTAGTYFGNANAGQVARIDASGNFTLSGTVDGVDIAARNSVLTSTTTTANAALPKAGGAMSGTLNMANYNLQNARMTGSTTYLPGHAYSNTHDGTNVYWHIGAASGSTNKVLNLRIYNSSNSYILNTWNTSGLSLYGNLTLSGTVDGVDIAARDGVLTSTTTTANAALPKAGGTMTGNLVLDSGTSTLLNVKCDNGGNAIVRAGGDGQGTGVFEVSQDNGSHGGGMSYNGDGSPAFVSGETNDNVTFYRINAGTRSEVFHYPYSSDTVNFNGNITLGGTVDGRNVAADGTKLDGIAASANNYSFPYSVSTGSSASHIVQRDGNGYILGNYLYMTGTFANSGAGGTMGYFTGTNGSDNYGRSWTAAQARTLLNVADGANNYSFPYTISDNAGNSSVVRRTGNGYIFANYFNTTANDVSSGITKLACETSNDSYIRWGTAAAVRSFLNVADGAIAASNAAITNKLLKTGGTMTGTLTSRDVLVGADYHLQRSNHHSGHLEGSYNNVAANGSKSNPIYTIGSSYNPTDAALSNMYGIGFCKSNSSFITGDLDAGGTAGWGMYVAADGDARVFLNGTDGTISTTGQHYADNNVVWNAGNDGSGSGLDADLLDGVHASAGSSAITASQVLKSHTNAYVYTNWINVGTKGIYSGTNVAHFYPNTLGSYGTWRINGTRGGYSGIMMDGGGDVVTGMFDGSGNGGDWNNSTSWHYYYHRANDCLSISGSTTSSSYAAYVNGALYATGDIVGSSDERLKTEIKTIPNALDKVLQLRGVTYKWKDTTEGGTCVNNITETRMGVIAQEVVDILPEVVTHDKENDRYGVSYGHLTGILIEAVKELKQEVNELKKELEEVKNG